MKFFSFLKKEKTLDEIAKEAGITVGQDVPTFTTPNIRSLYKFSIREKGCSKEEAEKNLVENAVRQGAIRLSSVRYRHGKRTYIIEATAYVSNTRPAA